MMAGTKTSNTRLTWWRAPRKGKESNIDIMEGAETETKGLHNGGHQKKKNEMDMMAGTKREGTR